MWCNLSNLKSNIRWLSVRKVRRLGLDFGAARNRAPVRRASGSAHARLLRALHRRSRANTSSSVYAFFKALLFLLPAEAAHNFAFAGLRLLMAMPLLGSWFSSVLVPRDPALRVRALGHEFPSPIGLAAGFDKNAVGYNALSRLGFGFVEVGTVTAQAQPGNPKPRLFRLPLDRAIVNRMGFNNLGAHAMSVQLLGPRNTVVGVNIGKTKKVPEESAVADYQHSARLLAPLSDYMVINVSSPNTPGLRNLQAVELLRPLLLSVRKEMDEACGDRHVALLVKIAPDLDDEEVDAIADLALEVGLDGIIATNTTLSRSGLETSAKRVEGIGAGGLSGPPLKTRSLDVLRRLRARVGNRLTLVSVGGIESVDDVWKRLSAGANLVQIYTSFIYGGPTLVHRLNRELCRRLRQHRMKSLGELHASLPEHPDR